MHCFIIWGHGLKYYDEIMKLIKDYFYVVTDAYKKIDDIEEFIKQIYVEEMQTIPFHIMAKNQHLLRCNQEARLILVKPKAPLTFSCSGHGPNNERCTTFVDHFKQTIRDHYNPKQPCGKRTEDHVIHGSDDHRDYRQVENCLRAFGLKSICEWAVADCLQWTGDDFECNKKESTALDQSDEMKIRRENLEELADAFRECGIHFWLQGKTLLGLFRYNRFLSPDNDDDIGVPGNLRIRICTEVYPLLKKRGFQAIRNTGWFLSVIRAGRYIDICFFTKRDDEVGYCNKWFPQEYFSEFSWLRFHERLYLVPKKTTELLNHMYPKAEKKGTTRYPLIKRTKQLSYNDFLSCKIEAEDSINWELRGPHLNLITDNGRYLKVAEIIRFFKEISNVEIIRRQSLIETDTSQPFAEPINLNSKFWQGGNNYFFNCICYGFKKDVIPYCEANNYIKNVNSPLLYSSEYYRSLPAMSYEEIKKFCQANPVIIDNGEVQHGKHRVCAMIGLIAAGGEYIPISVC